MDADKPEAGTRGGCVGGGLPSAKKPMLQHSRCEWWPHPTVCAAAAAPGATNAAAVASAAPASLAAPPAAWGCRAGALSPPG